MEKNTEDADCMIAVESVQECVGENKVGILNIGNRDVGSDNMKQAVDTREIIACMKLDLLS